MGYQTHFKVQTYPEASLAAVLADVKKASKLTFNHDGASVEGYTFYDHDDVFTEISLNHRDVVITVIGIGEEPFAQPNSFSPCWVKSYYNGVLTETSGVNLAALSHPEAEGIFVRFKGNA